MGLDQYAYVAAKAGQNDEWWEGAVFDEQSKDYQNPRVAKPKEIAYWRKHPNLQGWMERLWHRKQGILFLREFEFIEGKNPQDYGYFNGVELELTLDDINLLEREIKSGKISKLDTKGFFFGNPSDPYYREADLKFCREAKFYLFMGAKVFYNSSW